MFLTSRSSFKATFRHLKPFNTVSLLLFFIVLGGVFSFVFQGEHLKKEFRDFIYDSSTLFLSVVERPFNTIKGYQQNFNYHLYLQKNSQTLNKALSQLRAYKNKALSLEMRNKELRDLLSLQGTEDNIFITAPCFGQHSFLKTKSLFIHAGKQSGIQRFDVALSEGALIGQVDQVGGKVSRVLLISDPHSRIPIISEKSHQEGVLYGNGEAPPRLSFVKKPHTLQKGEIVFSSGVDGYFPRGKPIGTVSKIKEDDVFIKLLVDFKNLHYVQIQKSHGGEVK